MIIKTMDEPTKSHKCTFSTFYFGEFNMSSPSEQGRQDANNGKTPAPKGNAEYQAAYQAQQAKNSGKK